MGTFEPARLSGVGLVTLDSVGFRNQAPGFDVRSGEGARRFGGRYNPPGSFPVIYLCLTRPCVVAELTLQAMRQSVDLDDLLPRELWSVSSQLERAFDLTDASVLAEAGVDPTDLVRPDLPENLGAAALHVELVDPHGAS